MSGGAQRGPASGGGQSASANASAQTASAARGSAASLARTLLRGEALKTRKRLAVWVLLGLYVAVIAVPSVLSVTMANAGDPAGIPLPERGWTRIPLGTQFMAALCLGVGLALLVAPEFKWRTGRQNVIDGLSKGQFFVGKLLLWAGLTAALLLVAWTLGAVILLVLPPADGSVAPAVADLKAWTGLALAMGVWGGAAFFLAFVMRSGGPAVGILLGYFFVESIVSTIARMFAAVRDWDFVLAALDYLPGSVSERLSSHGLHYGSSMPPVEQELVGALGSQLGFTTLVCVALAYMAAFVALAYANFRKRDL